MARPFTRPPDARSASVASVSALFGLISSKLRGAPSASGTSAITIVLVAIRASMSSDAKLRRAARRALPSDHRGVTTTRYPQTRQEFGVVDSNTTAVALSSRVD
jgi:hypothetical protein